MWPDRVPLTYKSGALPIALRSPATGLGGTAWRWVAIQIGWSAFPLPLFSSIFGLKVNGYTFRNSRVFFYIPSKNVSPLG